MRHVFPNDRFSFRYALDQPLYPGTGTNITVFLDEAATQLAVIRTYPGDMAILGSVITVGLDSLVPEFYGPDGVTVLWGRPRGSNSTYRVDAQITARVAALEVPKILVLNIGVPVPDGTPPNTIIVRRPV